MPISPVRPAVLLAAVVLIGVATSSRHAVAQSAPDAKAAAPMPELANIPANHGVALWSQSDLANTLVYLLTRDEASESRDQMVKELGLRPDQRLRLKSLSQKASEIASKEWPDAPDRYFEAEEAILLAGLPEVLTKPQVARFGELHCQIEGLAILRVPAYAEKLTLTGDQKTKVKGLVKEYRDKSRGPHGAIFSAKGKDDARPHYAPLKALANELDVKILAILTAKQRGEWIRLVGKKYDWRTALDYPDEP